MVFFEDGKARPHRRAGMLCEPGGSQVSLSGVSDEEDERCHFTMTPGGKMTRVAGHPIEDIGPGMHRAGQLWHALANSPDLGDCDDEPLAMYPMVDVTPPSARCTSDELTEAPTPASRQPDHTTPEAEGEQ